MVSVGDHTIKKGSRYISDPAVMSMLEVQKRIAKETNIAFWNLFEAMGGEDSMYKWVHNSPAYAYKDYAHFSDAGGARIAELLYDSIMRDYKK
jgi:lysophospholipase L1-like esterase